MWLEFWVTTVTACVPHQALLWNLHWGQAEEETARSPPSHLLFISLYFSFLRKSDFQCRCLDQRSHYRTACQHSAVTLKITIMAPFRIFFSRKQTTGFFWNHTGTVLFVKMNRISIHTRLLPFPACRRHSSCRGGWCCIHWWESGKGTFEAGRIGQCAAVFVSGCRKRHDEDYMWILSC